MKKEWIFLTVALSSCISGGSMMTNQAFFDIPLGTNQNEVIASVGEPYEIHVKDDGSIEYEYIERFKVGARETEERHYFLIIKDGKVAAKRVESSSPPPYIFDSYEMQTTQKGKTDPD